MKNPIKTYLAKKKYQRNIEHIKNSMYEAYLESARRNGQVLHVRETHMISYAIKAED